MVFYARLSSIPPPFKYCEQSDCILPHPSSLLLMKNKQDQNVLTAPMAIVPTQNNFDCSITISQNQASQPAAKGYTILLANIVNNTDVR